MNKIEFIESIQYLTIRIPKDLLKWAAENNPNDPLIITDRDKFARQVFFELEHNLGSMGSGLSGFEELLDRACLKVAEGGYDFVDLKINEENKIEIYKDDKIIGSQG